MQDNRSAMDRAASPYQIGETRHAHLVAEAEMEQRFVPLALERVLRREKASPSGGKEKRDRTLRTDPCQLLVAREGIEPPTLRI